MIIGMIISDLEASSKTYRVLDKLRNLGPKMTILKNSVLIFMFLFMSNNRQFITQENFAIIFLMRSLRSLSVFRLEPMI